jgi:prepilin-type N-terminal cleavage/methylation domain-containing protein
VRTTSDFPYLIINQNGLARVLFSVILGVIKMMGKNSGFTALELATTVVLIALVAALVLLSYIR